MCAARRGGCFEARRELVACERLWADWAWWEHIGSCKTCGDFARLLPHTRRVLRWLMRYGPRPETWSKLRKKLPPVPARGAGSRGRTAGRKRKPR